MLEDIKNELLKNPEKIKDVLERFNYCSIAIHNTYISFGRDELSSKKSIVIKIENNKYLFVHDYARNIEKDLFSYIMDQRHVEFSDVIGVVKDVLGIKDYYGFFEKKSIFGGFYDKIKKHTTSKMFTYDKSVLDKYEKIGNLKFINDHISLEAQRFFNIGYDIESQGITIPIYDQIGQIIGIKIRANYDVDIERGELKYYYILPCSMSQTLYGYSQNYKYISNNTVYIFEAEKSVMQCYSYGIRNCVALGSGTVSKKQVQMLLELNPTKLIFMHDTGYKKEYIERNIKMIQAYSRFSEVQIGYWDYKKEEYEDKVSPSDLGKEKLLYILNNEITMLGDDDNEEEL